VRVPAASPILSRVERFERIGSTNDVVREWLADGTPEVAIAIADEQTAGRGRAGRTWTAPAGSSLLVSAGFRPTWLRPDHVWRLTAIVGMAMAEAAEATAGLPDGAVRLKWPNDLAVADGEATIRKLGGVLGESQGLGTDDVRAIVGIGVNVDWSGHEVPADIRPTMTTLSDSVEDASAMGASDRAADGRVTVEALATAYLDRLAIAVAALRDGEFPAAAWSGRQVTTGRSIVVELPGGERRASRAVGVDTDTGALLIEDDDGAGGPTSVLAADVVHVRLLERSV
jgi:BirA family biotin operon repressor/biotin-[acetyl-CoA-carboxylase] ligase